MEKFGGRSLVNEVYTQIIDVTIQAVEKYLKKSKKKFLKFDILEELKSRWQARINCLFYYLEGSWVKFQESRSKNSDFSKKIEFSFTSPSIYNFPLVCNLSFDFFNYFYLKKEIISAFKSWIWNCLIAQLTSEGIYPYQARAIKTKKKKFLKENKIIPEEHISMKYGKSMEYRQIK
jgi:hypothetical protein